MDFGAPSSRSFTDNVFMPLPVMQSTVISFHITINLRAVKLNDKKKCVIFYTIYINLLTTLMALELLLECSLCFDYIVYCQVASICK